MPSETLRERIAELERERDEAIEALVSIRDIDLPMVGDSPATDWLSWYTTAILMRDAAAKIVGARP